MYDPFNLKKIKSTQEIKQSIWIKISISLFLSVGLIVSGVILYKEAPLYKGPDILLMFTGLLPLFWTFFVLFYEARHASREQMVEIIYKMHDFPEIKNIFCDYMEKRNYLTVDEYDRFRLTIERTKEKQKEKQADLEWKEALQSLCNKR